MPDPTPYEALLACVIRAASYSEVHSSAPDKSVFIKQAPWPYCAEQARLVLADGTMPNDIRCALGGEEKASDGCSVQGMNALYWHESCMDETRRAESAEARAVKAEREFESASDALFKVSMALEDADGGRSGTYENGPPRIKAIADRVKAAEMYRRNSELVRVSSVIQDAFGSPRNLELALEAYGVEGDSSCMSDYRAFYDMAAQSQTPNSL